MRKKPKAIAKVKIRGKMFYLQVANALTNSAPPKKYIRRLDLEFKTINIDSSVKIATKTTTITCIVSFANRFTQTIAKIKMMISG